MRCWVGSDSWGCCEWLTSIVPCPQQPCLAPADSSPRLLLGNHPSHTWSPSFPAAFSFSPALLSFPKNLPSHDVSKYNSFSIVLFCLQESVWLICSETCWFIFLVVQGLPRALSTTAFQKNQFFFPVFFTVPTFTCVHSNQECEVVDDLSLGLYWYMFVLGDLSQFSHRCLSESQPSLDFLAAVSICIDWKKVSTSLTLSLSSLSMLRLCISSAILIFVLLMFKLRLNCFVTVFLHFHQKFHITAICSHAMLPSSCLKLSLFLPPVPTPSSESSRVFHMCSAFRLSKWEDKMHPFFWRVHTSIFIIVIYVERQLPWELRVPLSLGCPTRQGQDWEDDKFSLFTCEWCRLEWSAQCHSLTGTPPPESSETSAEGKKRNGAGHCNFSHCISVITHSNCPKKSRNSPAHPSKAKTDAKYICSDKTRWLFSTVKNVGTGRGPNTIWGHSPLRSWYGWSANET